ncbi:MAG: acyltransferase family protein [Roseimicrobium sp.]
MSPSAFNNGDGARIPVLDGIRGIAVLLVLAWHYVGAPGAALCERLPVLGAFLSFGSSGVDLFFVLSGFLICGILLDHKGAPNYFPTFYVRRMCRIFPLYFALLAAYWACATAQRTGMPEFARFSWLFANPLPIWSYATFTQNIWMGLGGTFGPNWLGITWSLAVEEQFYLLMPLLVHWCSRRTLTFVLLAAVVSAPLLQWAWPGFHAYVCLPWRCESVVVGSLLALCYRDAAAMAFVRTTNWLWAAFAVFSAGVGVMVWDRSALGVFTHLWWACLYGCVLLLVLTRPTGALSRAVQWPVFMRFGLLSYGCYMTHQLVNGVMHGLVRGAGPTIDTLTGVVVTAVALLVTLVLATLSHRYFESPIVLLGKRFRYTPAVPASPQT